VSRLLLLLLLFLLLLLALLLSVMVFDSSLFLNAKWIYSLGSCKVSDISVLAAGLATNSALKALRCVFVVWSFLLVYLMAF
jgi:hypothetical protein